MENHKDKLNKLIEQVQVLYNRLTNLNLALAADVGSQIMIAKIDHMQGDEKEIDKSIQVMEAIIQRIGNNIFPTAAKYPIFMEILRIAGKVDSVSLSDFFENNLHTGVNTDPKTGYVSAYEYPNVAQVVAMYRAFEGMATDLVFLERLAAIMPFLGINADK